MQISLGWYFGYWVNICLIIFFKIVVFHSLLVENVKYCWTFMAYNFVKKSILIYLNSFIEKNTYQNTVFCFCKGWKRETIIKGLGKNGNIKGDVSYIAPDSSNKFRQMSDVTQVSLFGIQSFIYIQYKIFLLHFSTWSIKTTQNFQRITLHLVVGWFLGTTCSQYRARWEWTLGNASIWLRKMLLGGRLKVLWALCFVTFIFIHCRLPTERLIKIAISCVNQTWNP